MVKKIIYSAIALTILIFGYNSFNRLRYWDRSVQIFKMNSGPAFGRGFERARPTFNRNSSGERNLRSGERVAIPDFGNRPDSLRQQFRVQPDSVRQQNSAEIQRSDRGSFRGRGFDEGARRRGGFQQGRNIRLNTVYRFLAVFAALTVLTIYVDKLYKQIRRRKKQLVKIT